MSNNNEFGLKEIYDLTLKATYPIEMAGRKFEPGEVIARFDKIQLANFKEITNRVSANGGFDNRAHVIWEDPKEIQLSFTQGIFSSIQFALLSNSRLVQKKEETSVLVPWHYKGESDEEGRINVNKNSFKMFLFIMREPMKKLFPNKSIQKMEKQ